MRCGKIERSRETSGDRKRNRIEIWLEIVVCVSELNEKNRCQSTNEISEIKM